MCTAMTLETAQGRTLFGRTMDFSYQLDPGIYTVPRGYLWHNSLRTHRIRNQYAFIGIGQELSPVVFADGVNEKGFAAAALYFPGCARYDPVPAPGSPEPPIAAIELVQFLLGMCGSVDQAAALLRSIRIVGTKDSVTGSVAPLHWIAAEESGRCVVIEKTAGGLRIMENPVGVLSNSPEFPWHMTNLRGYMSASPFQLEEEEWSGWRLTPFGQGAGAFGLPGDYSPPSRFVRTVYQKSHVFLPPDRDGAVAACFHLLEGVSIPKGAVMTARGAPDYTQYTAFIDLSAREYFFRTYTNSQITSARLSSGSAEGGEISCLGKLAGAVSFSRLGVE